MQLLSRYIVIVLLSLFVVVGCDRDKASQGNTGDKVLAPVELLLYCGAGLRPPVVDVIAEFTAEHKNIKILPDYAGSEVLLSKLKLIKKGDLYLPGDKHYLEQAKEVDLIYSQSSVCFFVPTILVQKGNPKNIKTVQDLLKPNVKVGIGDPKACAIGRKTKKIFKKNDISFEEISKNIIYQSLTVNELGLQIKTKTLDAVIVWDAIGKYYADVADEIKIPVNKNVISTVEAGVLSVSENQKAAVMFMEFLSSEKGNSIFRKHNYRVDPPL